MMAIYRIRPRKIQDCEITVVAEIVGYRGCWYWTFGIRETGIDVTIYGGGGRAKRLKDARRAASAAVAGWPYPRLMDFGEAEAT